VFYAFEMNEHEPFLKGILAQPDDDTRRLVYADWLEERGDQRCELIRLQCALDKLPVGPEREELDERALQLMEAEVQSPGPLVQLGERLQIQNGYVENVTFGPRNLLGRSDIPFRASSFQTERLAKTPVFLRLLSAVPFLWREDSLEVRHSELGAADVQLLASSIYASRLATLDLSHNRIGNDGISALVRSPYLGKLTTLKLYDAGLNSCAMGGTGVSAAAILSILLSPNLPNLANLDVAGNGIGSHIVTLAACPALARLQSLDLFGNGIGDSGARALAESRYVAGLKNLGLGNNGIGDEGCFALASSPYLAGLTSLNLYDNSVEAAGAAALDGSPYLKNAKTDLAWNPCLGVETYIHEIAERYG